MAQSTVKRNYRSVLDYETEEELVRALEQSSLSSVKKQDEEDEGSASSPSDWQLSVYDPNTTSVPTVQQEATRLMNVRDYRILETEQEEEFDRVIGEVQQLYQVPWAFVSIVDLGRQWFKAQAAPVAAAPAPAGPSPSEVKNPSVRETSRQESFCAHTILQRDIKGVFQVTDASQDSRFCSSRLVVSGDKLRFYAGAPLVSPEGQRLGALCMVDKKPRPEGLTSSQQDKLLELAASTVDLLVQRRERVRAAEKKGEQTSSSAVGEQPSSRSSQETALVSEDEATRVHRVRQPVAAQQRVQERRLSSSSSSQRGESQQPNSAPKRTTFTPQPPLMLQHSPPSSPTPEAPVKKSRSLPSLPALTQSTSSEAQGAAVVSSFGAAPTSVPEQPQPILRPNPTVPLPDPKASGVHPDEFLSQLIEAMYGAKIKIKPALDLHDFFPVIQEEQMAAYSIDVVSATRENNVQKLQTFYQQRGRQSLDCYNRFGEGLLNLSCRRGFEDIVEFLVSDPVALNVRICDDYGRTPLHDACWHPEPQLKICRLLLQRDPSLFLVADKRGFTPFQYARSSDWHIWRDFLFEQRELLLPLAQPETLAHFGE